MNKKRLKHLKKWKPGEIQTTIMIAFSLISISIVLCMGRVMYILFSSASRQEGVNSTAKLMEQTEDNIEEYLVNMRQVSDAAYYNIIKETNFVTDLAQVKEQMQLLYEANKDKLRSIAVYKNNGELLAAEPVVAQKEDANVTSQQWFVDAESEVENIHFQHLISKISLMMELDDITGLFLPAAQWICQMERSQSLACFLLIWIIQVFPG